ncbi:pectinesterase-like [Phoenix dactylifera]|uniref:Pectinesterase n=1 Tax=Phoenix dactylifera TaxID=42345 RepID=A0A8B7CZK4_PHODC|nr:pectinesterase-like [Phoenix dactylifera]
MEQSHEPLLSSPATCRKSTHRCNALLFTLSLASLICTATLITVQLNTNTTTPNPSHLCANSPSPAPCNAVISTALSALGRRSKPDPVQVLQTILHQSLLQIDSFLTVADNFHRPIDGTGSIQRSALADCIHLMDLSRDLLRDSASAISAEAYTEARTWLSAALTNHVTCSDGLTRPIGPLMEAHLESLTALASASLAVLSAVSPSDGDAIERVRRFPSWLTVKDRKLLESSSSDGIAANVTVAAEGSGDYKTVQEAVDSAPDKGKVRYVIYVKEGTYKENVVVGKKKTNVMIVGDGMNSTVITGSLNVVDGSTTFNSATFAAVGEGFILQDICIENTAGPEKHQAVALRVGADRSAINRCRLDGYQDTLYAHSLRQFYRDSVISGTVDFIFGNAAVVFQNCNLIARKPMSHQQNLVTAQGRVDPNQNTGTSIQSCKVVPSDDLKPVKGSIPTYLGRPWKEYSRTVFMQSYIDDHVDPKGWMEWSGDFALDTLYYGEYANIGPGAGTSGRVNWTGYHVITDPNVAKDFTVAGLIQGGTWLQPTGVAFTEGL